MNIELDKVVIHFRIEFPETRVVKSILADIFPKERPEINLLTTIYDSGFVKKLVSMPQCAQNNFDAAVTSIAKETFLAEQHIREALNMWLAAYHKNIQSPNLKDIKVGNIIKFGVTWQNYEHIKEPIEWLILAIENNMALLISLYALDCMEYHEKFEEISWENCSLRKHMNDFYEYMFSDTEKKSILLSKILTNQNPKYPYCQSNNTEDKVFLLSVEEAEKYFKSDETRCCIPTKFAACCGGLNYDEPCWWWLRSNGSDSESVALVNVNGVIDDMGEAPIYHTGAIRPALWINLKP